MSDSAKPLPLVYLFGAGEADAGADLKDYVGGKGASLAEMTRAGLQVPPGFTISAHCCALFHANRRQWPPLLETKVREALAWLENLAGRQLGQGGDPLLVAVRSGAAQSMPGMMDTVLNVGLNPTCVRAMVQRTGNARGAWESYRHFLTMFGHTVAGVADAVLDDAIAGHLRTLGISQEEELDAAGMESLCDRLADAIANQAGHPVPTDPWELLRQAINAIFDSWNSERANTYRQRHQADGLLGTAVNVQMMCPSEASGVLFTANPVNPGLDQIIVEGSFGLGEAVVLGKVTPDRFVLDKKTLAIVERAIADKTHIVATLAQDGQARQASRNAASLSDGQVIELRGFGMRVEKYFQTACDIEWGLSGGTFYLLQARPIKGLDKIQQDDAEREQIRQEEIAALQGLAEPGGTVWSRFNLSEILPDPTPMTWGIVRHFMSGRGGYGLMYRDLGFDPDPALDEIGVFDLVCGRPYCNLSREPAIQYRALPFEHSLAKLKTDPTKAVYPQAVFNPARANWSFWLFLPFIFWKLAASAGKLQRLSLTFAEHFKNDIVPPFAEETRRAWEEDWSRLKPDALLQRLDYWRRRTLVDFARESLKPTVFAALALGNLERALVGGLKKGEKGETRSVTERSQAALRELTMGVHPEPEADLPGALRQLAQGKIAEKDFLQRFGHRGAREMELAEPRWSEDASGLARLKAASQVEISENKVDGNVILESLAESAKLGSAKRQVLKEELDRLRVYVGQREAGKHYLLMGYALIRRILQELDQRFDLKGGIFFLTPDELPELLRASSATKEFKDRIAQRKRRRELALSLSVPQVLFSDDLEAIGRPLDTTGSDTLQGTPLSAGVAEGLALVLEQPSTQELPAEPFILVCPTTDPAWVPLFMHARGLVMETGGVLSHGAIVAREFGLPAVAGLPDVHRRLRTGQRLRVDGGTGRVNLLA